ncbi:MAG: methyltransferase [Leptolyngbyaceae cyanobacterium SL_7_1]|nr:methyltransferase [Leptolyngbyaceae cyanobacterium SL_7_1]
MAAYEIIYEVVRKIPYGQVATYGQIAALANLPGQARLVGYALFRVDTRSSDVPWHRVINAKGQVSESPFRNGADDLQRVLLEEEGIQFSASGTIDLQQYRWRSPLPLNPSHLNYDEHGLTATTDLI